MAVEAGGLLVLFTDHVYNAIDFMGKLCTLMVDWTQYSRAVRLVREAEEEAERARLAAEAEAGAWKESSLEDVKRYILEQM